MYKDVFTRSAATTRRYSASGQSTMPRTCQPPRRLSKNRVGPHRGARPLHAGRTAIKVRLALACALLFACGCASAAQPQAETAIPPPDIPAIPANVPATLHRPPSVGVSFGPLRIRFEETTLDDVRRQVGAGHIAHRGDAGDSLAWLCYTIPDGERPGRLWLTSGELQGNKYIGGVTAKLEAAGAQPAAQCPTLPPRFRPATLDHALWLGAPSDQIRKALGSPSHEADGWQMFDYAKPFNHGQCEQQNRLWIKSAGGRAVLIDAGQNSSC